MLPFDTLLIIAPDLESWLVLREAKGLTIQICPLLLICVIIFHVAKGIYHVHGIIVSGLPSSWSAAGKAPYKYILINTGKNH